MTETKNKNKEMTDGMWNSVLINMECGDSMSGELL